MARSSFSPHLKFGAFNSLGLFIAVLFLGQSTIISAGFEDVRSASLRADGLYNVICMDNSFEFGVTREDIIQDNVCNGSTNDPDPDPSPGYLSFLQYCQMASPSAEIEATLNAIRLEFDTEDCAEINGYLNELDYLFLPEGGVMDLAPIARLTHLTNLNLRANSIVDITPLAGLENLVRLDLRTNQIENLLPLVQLNQLTSFRVAENPIGTTIAIDPQNCPQGAMVPAAIRAFCESAGSIE